VMVMMMMVMVMVMVWIFPVYPPEMQNRKKARRQIPMMPQIIVTCFLCLRLATEEFHLDQMPDEEERPDDRGQDHPDDDGPDQPRSSESDDGW